MVIEILALFIIGVFLKIHLLKSRLPFQQDFSIGIEGIGSIPSSYKGLSTIPEMLWKMQFLVIFLDDALIQPVPSIKAQVCRKQLQILPAEFITKQEEAQVIMSV